MSTLDPQGRPENKTPLTNTELWMAEIGFWVCYLILLSITWAVVSALFIPD